MLSSSTLSVEYKRILAELKQSKPQLRSFEIAKGFPSQITALF